MRRRPETMFITVKMDVSVVLFYGVILTGHLNYGEQEHDFCCVNRQCSYLGDGSFCNPEKYPGSGICRKKRVAPELGISPGQSVQTSPSPSTWTTTDYTEGTTTDYTEGTTTDVTGGTTTDYTEGTTTDVTEGTTTDYTEGTTTDYRERTSTYREPFGEPVNHPGRGSMGEGGCDCMLGYRLVGRSCVEDGEVREPQVLGNRTICFKLHCTGFKIGCISEFTSNPEMESHLSVCFLRSEHEYCVTETVAFAESVTESTGCASECKEEQGPSKTVSCCHGDYCNGNNTAQFQAEHQDEGSTGCWISDHLHCGIVLSGLLYFGLLQG